MQIRSGEPRDIAAMVALLGELFSIEDDFVIDPSRQERGLKLLLESAEADVLVAEEGSEVIGMITLQPLVSTAMGERVGLIEDVVVTRGYRGKGIGSALLAAAVERSRERGYARLALGADRRNAAAIAFYHERGFTTSQMGLMYRFL